MKDMIESIIDYLVIFILIYAFVHCTFFSMIQFLEGILNISYGIFVWQSLSTVTYGILGICKSPLWYLPFAITIIILNIIQHIRYGEWEND